MGCWCGAPPNRSDAAAPAWPPSPTRTPAIPLLREDQLATAMRLLDPLPELSEGLRVSLCGRRSLTNGMALLGSSAYGACASTPKAFHNRERQAMSQSLSQIYLHVTFSTNDRAPFLRDRQRCERMHKSMPGQHGRPSRPPPWWPRTGLCRCVPDTGVGMPPIGTANTRCLAHSASHKYVSRIRFGSHAFTTRLHHDEATTRPARKLDKLVLDRK